MIGLSSRRQADLQTRLPAEVLADALAEPVSGAGLPESFLQQLNREYCRLDSQERKTLLTNIYVLLKEPRQHAKCADISLLTDRELEVLVLISNGYCRREIAGCLEISANTAARHISNIYSKLRISSVAEATRFAMENGLTGQLKNNAQ